MDYRSPVREEREARYVRIMKTYRERERSCFGELFVIMANAMETKPDQDFLGEMFMALELGNHWKGQFFTPYHLCEFMAKCTMQDVEAHIERRGWVGVMENCTTSLIRIAAA